jgi:hypothetical protein
MDARRNTNTGFLVILFLSIAVGASAIPQSRRAGIIYVSIQSGNCTQTKLRLELDGVTPKPASVMLRVTRDNDKVEVINQELNLNDDGNYYWSGLLAPLGKYKAELFDERNNSLALGKPFVFNNIDILKSFIREERGEITYISRGGDEAQNAQNNDDRKTLTVNQLPTPTGQNQIHIVVMNDRGNKADEYSGPPPGEQRWSSKPLRLGQYRLIVAEYKNDQSCQIVRGR